MGYHEANETHVNPAEHETHIFVEDEVGEAYCPVGNKREHRLVEKFESSQAPRIGRRYLDIEDLEKDELEEDEYQDDTAAFLVNLIEEVARADETQQPRESCAPVVEWSAESGANVA